MKASVLISKAMREFSRRGVGPFGRACWFMLCSKAGVRAFQFRLFGAPFYVRSNQEKLGIDGALYSRREFYENELQAWFRLPVEGGVFLDIGANYGFWSRFVLKDSVARQLPDFSIVAFEPLPTNYQQLKKNIAADPEASRVSCVQLALGDRNGTVYMTHSNSDPGSTFVGTTGDVPVRLTSLDQYTSEHPVGRVAVVKIDVEGFEPAVLRGARQTLARDKPLIICEVVKSHLARNGFTPMDVFSELTRLGYSGHSITPEGALVPVSTISKDGDYIFR